MTHRIVSTYLRLIITITLVNISLVATVFAQVQPKAEQDPRVQELEHVDPTAQQSVRTVDIYSLKNAAAETALSILQSTFEGPERIRLTFDPRNNAIIALGTRLYNDLIQALLERLDVSPIEATQPQTVEVSFLLIVEKSESVPGLSAPNEKTLELLNELEPHAYIPPFTSPVVGGLVVTRVAIVPEGERRTDQPNPMEQPGLFNNKSTTAGGILQTLVKGMVKLRENGVIWEGSLEIQLKQEVEVFQTEIGTRITLPLDHPVILGFTQIGGINGIVIMEAKQIKK
jgi:hypothetical protein